MNDVQQHICVSCGQPSSANGKSVLCVSETAVLSKGKDGNTSTTWHTTDKKDWNLFICSHCISSKYEDRLKAELVESKKHLKTSVICLVGSVAFLPIASTGIFRGMGGINGLIALFWTGCFLFGLFGSPAYFYALIKKRRGLAAFRQSGTIPEAELGELYVKEGERILTELQAGKSEDVALSCYPLPTFEETNSVKRRRITSLPPS